MPDTIEKSAILNGGEFLIKDSNVEGTFIPEDANEEQLMIKEMTKDFLEN